MKMTFAAGPAALLLVLAGSALGQSSGGEAPGGASEGAGAGPGGGGDGAGPGEITKPPKLIKFVPAVYPKQKHDAGTTASVLLSIEIGDDGRVGEVEVLKPAAPDFDAAAVAAVKQFIFEPAEIDHQPAPVKITYRYDFTIVTEIVAAGPQVNFDGVVLERFKKRPLRDVTVAIQDLDVSAVTDEAGAFAFTDVPPGVHKIALSHPKLITILTDETIAKGKKRTVKYLVEEKEEGVDEEVVVRAPRIKKEAVETRIRTEEARRVPGTQGDTLKVIQNLPGVGRSAFGSGALIVWGSAPKDTRVNVDGVEIPALYHVGGLRSTVNSDLVKGIELSPGSYGADYGRGLGGLVKVELRPLPAEGVHGYIAADVIDASAMLSFAVTRRLRLAIAGRQSYLDRVLTKVTSQDVGDFVPIPRYDDYQARATLALRRDEDLAVTFLASDDHLRRTIPATDPLEQRFQNNDSSYKRFIVRYTRLLDDGSSLVVTPSIGFDHSASVSRFGTIPIELRLDTWQYALRSSFRRRLDPHVTLSIGADFQGRSVRAQRNGSVNQPPREGDIVVFGQPPGPDTNFDAWQVHQATIAPYVALEVVAGRFTLSPGLRFEPTLTDGDRVLPLVPGTLPIGYSRLDLPANPADDSLLRWAPNPRLVASYRAGKRLNFTLGGGVYAQPADPEDLSPVFGNPRLGMSRAVHASGGFSYKLTPTLALESVGFYKRYYDLVSRSPLPTPPVAQALTQDGVGRSYGGQLLLRQELKKGFFGWLTYSLIRSERRDHPGLPYRLFDFDQTHIFGILASYDLGHGWEIGGRFRYTSGLPRTPVVGAFANNNSGIYEPVFGAQNSIRIPAFYQLDARIEKAIVVRGAKASLFLDLQNLTNRKNPEELIYNFDFSRRSTITGLPTLAVFGGRVEF
jgi:TonB family protein